MKELTPPELARYSRHITLPEVGVEGQMKLKSAAVLLIGLGGLGSPISLYLAAAGVGRIGLVDFDSVDESNLQRQIIHGHQSLNTPKVISAKKKLLDLNPLIEIDIYQERLTPENALNIIQHYDLVADGADNFATRYLVNDACVLSKKPLVSGAILKFEGQLSVFNYQDGPCYRCLYPKPPQAGAIPSCAEGGVLGVLPGVIGSLQANEILKIILGIGEVMSGSLLYFDALNTTFNTFSFKKSALCLVCRENTSIKDLSIRRSEYNHSCEILKTIIDEISAQELSHEKKDLTLIDVREEYERKICYISDSLHLPLEDLEHTQISAGPNTPIVVYCKKGLRSIKGAQILRNRGFNNIRSLKGGILDWINEIDSSLLKY